MASICTILGIAGTHAVVAQARPASSSETASLVFLVILGVTGIVVSIALALVLRKEKLRRRELEARFGELLELHQQAGGVSRQREEIMFEQHREMNALTLGKIKLECQLIEAQLRLAAAETGRRADAEEFHSQMIEKTRHEIESLKLHIREQKKRLDEGWQSFGDD